MKLIRKRIVEAAPSQTPQAPPWKVLIVDDEEDVHSVTRLSLRHMELAGRGLELLSARSGQEARAILAQEREIAVALVDVVMESDDAGLRLVEHIRNELRNRNLRIIIRTGQPGVAPEREVIDHYDIDDYKDKTELTSQKLYTTIRTALKGYRDLMTLETNRRGLEHILAATPGLYLPHFQDVDQFFRGVLTQVIGLCRFGENGVLATTDGFVSTLDRQEVKVLAGTGKFASPQGMPPEIREKVRRYSRIALEARPPEPGEIPEDSMLLRLGTGQETLGFIFLESTRHLTEDDQHLLQVLVNQCTAALENLRLHLDLKEANRESLFMLAVAAEFKDRDTGTHIQRLAEYTRLLALEMGASAEEAGLYGQASMLHDIGKLGIPDEVLQKPGRLTDEERSVMMEHPAIGAHILEQHQWFQLARDIALGHHERWDGQGYPSGLRGEAIPLVTRIVSVADVFDALSHARPYKDAWPLEQSTAAIRAGAGSQFDPAVVDAFFRLLERGVFPLVDA